MSLSGALSNALSGLTANSRAATLISSNIANATTESYGRRVLSLSPRTAGSAGGVWIDGVQRQVDTGVLADRRLSDAQAGFAGDMQTFATRFADLLGESGEEGSLTARFTAFENALTSASSNTASTQRLQTVAHTARDFARTMNSLSGDVQQARVEADQSVARQVGTLNGALQQVRQLNSAIAETMVRNGDASSLMDERQRAIDTISDIVPLRTVERDNGGLALYAASGTVLLDSMINSQPAEIGFTPTEPITADMTLTGGALSGLSINRQPINSGNAGPLGGGTLGAQLQIRDRAAPDMQAVLDGLARDLVERFGPGGPDGTLTPGDPGLFTDAGAAFNPVDETGLAGRISLNSLVEPDGAGLWRLRDGLGAATPGPVGDATLIGGYSDTLDALVAPASAALGTGARSFASHVADFHAAVSAARVRADGEVAYNTARHTALRELELSKGVDTDAELQTLMRVEQHYAANARVMTVVDDLMQTLLSI
ncbi:flagellar hook-associated protein FlgK [Salipiger mucosus]|uniref:Flagellar hook-associated protein 1 n=1 Tax=Salipiger mucosus DSM 16094 TaxID=1123237 RepID=S9QSR7_9RHOB|nr:flagellar hook-associated protein FlgK [Salipiger mucosus]EPX82632.1 Flagellar hook-associated protein FlgK [Salipiger mucosus DSM 16094]